MMRLEQTVKKAQLLEITAHMSIIWVKWCRLGHCVCVLVLSDLTRQPLLGEGRKSWYIITHVNTNCQYLMCVGSDWCENMATSIFLGEVATVFEV